jgi:hypothetical protein
MLIFFKASEALNGFGNKHITKHNFSLKLKKSEAYWASAQINCMLIKQNECIMHYAFYTKHVRKLKFRIISWSKVSETCTGKN